MRVRRRRGKRNLVASEKVKELTMRAKRSKVKVKLRERQAIAWLFLSPEKWISLSALFAQVMTQLGVSLNTQTSTRCKYSNTTSNNDIYFNTNALYLTRLPSDTLQHFFLFSSLSPFPRNTPGAATAATTAAATTATTSSCRNRERE